KVIGDPLVLTEHVADLARTDSDIAGRHVDVRTDVAIELGHEALAEPHDFAVGLALRIEVRPALSSADGKSGERILEGLLEGQKLEHAFVDARVKAQAAFVRSDRVVVLDAIASLDTHVAGVVLPADAERNDPIRLREPTQDLRRPVNLLVGDELENVFGDILHGLDEFRLVRIVLPHGFHERREVDVVGGDHSAPWLIGGATARRAILSSRLAQWRGGAATYGACHFGGDGALSTPDRGGQ